MKQALKRIGCRVLPVLIAWLMTSSGIDQAQAIVFNAPDRTEPRLTLTVGHPGRKIDVVIFDVPAANIGDGTVITNPDPVDFKLVIRATASNPLLGSLSVDSSVPLTNGTSTLPFTQFSWTSGEGDIPDGTFSGTANQQLASFMSSVRAEDSLIFHYANTLALEAGTYTGRVTYTLAFP